MDETQLYSAIFHGLTEAGVPGVAMLGGLLYFVRKEAWKMIHESRSKQTEEIKALLKTFSDEHITALKESSQEQVSALREFGKEAQERAEKNHSDLCGLVRKNKAAIQEEADELKDLVAPRETPRKRRGGGEDD